MGEVITTIDRSKDRMPATPRQRVSLNRTSPVTLTGDWQTLPLTSVVSANGSAFNTNTFDINHFDTVTNTVMANPSNAFEQAYNLSLDLAVKSNSTSTGVKLQVRFKVNSPTPLYFPLPDSLGYIELPDEITGAATTGLHFEYPVYTNAAIRQYGAEIQVNYRSYKLNSNLLTGLVNTVTQALTGAQRPQIIDATLNMYAV